MITLEELKELLSFNPDTGEFTWLVNRGRSKKGTTAGSTSSKGYRTIKLKGNDYKAHRLAWLYHYGHWPEVSIDHINCSRSDNRISNLREATEAENRQNLSSPYYNSTGYPGVSKNWDRWMAKITLNGVQKYLGTFDTPEEAHLAYLKAKEELHPFYNKNSNECN